MSVHDTSGVEPTFLDRRARGVEARVSGGQKLYHGLKALEQTLIEDRDFL